MARNNYVSVRLSELEYSKISDISKRYGKNISTFVRDGILEHIEIIEASKETSEDVFILDEALTRQKDEILLTLNECMRFLFYLMPSVDDGDYQKASTLCDKRMKTFTEELSKTLKSHGVG